MEGFTYSAFMPATEIRSIRPSKTASKTPSGVCTLKVSGRILSHGQTFILEHQSG